MMKIKSRLFPIKSKVIISVIILLVILIGFNQCVFTPNFKANVNSTSRDNIIPPPSTNGISDPNQAKDLPPGVDMPGMNAPVTAPDLALVDVGVKNFEQINITMSQLTGIPINNSTVQPVYNSIVIQLPTDNNLKNFLPSMQVAITKLATEYCDRLVETGALKSTIWPIINFSQTPTQTLTASNKILFINQTIEYFFGPIDADSVNIAREELLSLYDTLITGESLTTNATTKKVVKGICTASLSSAYVTFF
jgi:hypothetical protein